DLTDHLVVDENDRFLGRHRRPRLLGRLMSAIASMSLWYCSAELGGKQRSAGRLAGHQVPSVSSPNASIIWRPSEFPNTMKELTHKSCIPGMMDWTNWNHVRTIAALAAAALPTIALSRRPVGGTGA